MPSVKLTYPHLNGCMRHLSPTASQSGMCFHRSAALVLDLPGSEVVMGTVRAATPEEILKIPNASRTPFIHCWVEHNGAVLAPTLIERMGNRLIPQNRDSYYAMNGVKNLYRITRDELLRAAKGTGLSAHLRYGEKMKGDWTAGKLLLETAGVPYALTEWGSVVPPQEA